MDLLLRTRRDKNRGDTYSLALGVYITNVVRCGVASPVRRNGRQGRLAEGQCVGLLTRSLC